MAKLGEFKELPGNKGRDCEGCNAGFNWLLFEDAREGARLGTF